MKFITWILIGPVLFWILLFLFGLCAASAGAFVQWSLAPVVNYWDDVREIPWNVVRFMHVFFMILAAGVWVAEESR